MNNKLNQKMLNNIVENDCIRINYEGIDLIRNMLVYKHINYSDINYVEVGKGRDIKGWKYVSILGIGIVCFSLYLIIHTSANLDWSSSDRSYFLIYLSLFFLLLFGGGVFIRSVMKKYMIKIMLQNKQRVLCPLSKNKEQLVLIIDFLKSLDIVVYRLNKI